MNDAITLLLNETIDSNLTEDELLTSVADKQQAITEASATLSEAERAIKDNRSSITVRQQRAATMAAETARRRSVYTKKYFDGTFKASIEVEAALRVQEDGARAVLLDSAAYGESLIEGLHAARRAATLRLLETQRDWCHAQGLVEARKAYNLFVPVLQNDPNAKIDLKSSKTAAYATKVLEMEKLITEFRAKEATYGSN